MNWNEYFTYRDGKIFWKQVNLKSNRKPGDEAGSFNNSNGRFVVTVNKKRTLRSRVIWELHNGPIPFGMDVDHEDRDSTNDKIENLRLATRSENLANRRTNPISGYKGVKQRGNRWRVYLGSREYLGSFSTPEEAALAYNVAAFDKWGSFACLNEVVL